MTPREYKRLRERFAQRGITEQAPTLAGVEEAMQRIVAESADIQDLLAALHDRGGLDAVDEEQAVQELVAPLTRELVELRDVTLQALFQLYGPALPSILRVFEAGLPEAVASSAVKNALFVRMPELADALHLAPKYEHESEEAGSADQNVPSPKGQ